MSQERQNLMEAHLAPSTARATPEQEAVLLCMRKRAPGLLFGRTGFRNASKKDCVMIVPPIMGSSEMRKNRSTHLHDDVAFCRIACELVELHDQLLRRHVARPLSIGNVVVDLTSPYAPLRDSLWCWYAKVAVSTASKANYKSVFLALSDTMPLVI